jgi:c-di-GMP-binding flagellar brake protein YcgR
MNTKDREVNLTAGLGTELLIEIKGTGKKFKSHLVGMEPEAYLIIRLPLTLGIMDRIKPQSAFIVRYVCSGNVYGFSTSVLGSIINPLRLVFLSYPEKVEIVNLREKARVCCHLPAIAYLENKKLEGVILDINSKGVRFVSTTPKEEKHIQVKLGDDIKLSFPIVGMEGIQDFYGKVRNTVQDRERISLGVEFEMLDSTLSDKIESYARSVGHHI